MNAVEGRGDDVGAALGDGGDDRPVPPLDLDLLPRPGGLRRVREAELVGDAQRELEGLDVARRDGLAEREQHVGLHARLPGRLERVDRRPLQEDFSFSDRHGLDARHVPLEEREELRRELLRGLRRVAPHVRDLVLEQQPVARRERGVVHAARVAARARLDQLEHAHAAQLLQHDDAVEGRRLHQFVRLDAAHERLPRRVEELRQLAQALGEAGSNVALGPLLLRRLRGLVVDVREEARDEGRVGRRREGADLVRQAVPVLLHEGVDAVAHVRGEVRHAEDAERVRALGARRLHGHARHEDARERAPPLPDEGRALVLLEELLQQVLVFAVPAHALRVQQREDAVARVLQRLEEGRVVLERQVADGHALGGVLARRRLEDLRVELAQEPLVRVVDQQLLQAVRLEALEAKDVQQPDRQPVRLLVARERAAGADGRLRHGLERVVDAREHPVEDARVQRLAEGLGRVLGLRGLPRRADAGDPPRHQSFLELRAVDAERARRRVGGVLGLPAHPQVLTRDRRGGVLALGLDTLEADVAEVAHGRQRAEEPRLGHVQLPQGVARHGELGRVVDADRRARRRRVAQHGVARLGVAEAHRERQPRVALLLLPRAGDELV